MTWYLNSKLQRCRRIVFRNINRQVRLGAYDHERLAAQPVLFNLEVFVNTSNEKDNILNAFNYDLVVEAIDDVIESGHIDLQETLVDAVANKLLSYEAVVALSVRSEKTQAYPDVESVGVEIFREKDV